MREEKTSKMNALLRRENHKQEMKFCVRKLASSNKLIKRSIMRRECKQFFFW